MLDLEPISEIDPTAADALIDGIATARDHDITVAVTRATQPIRELLDRYGITELIGAEHVFDSNRAARAAFVALLLSDIGDRALSPPFAHSAASKISPSSSSTNDWISA